MTKQSVLIIGAGISGATLAERFAHENNANVVIVEKRNHVGGNCFDYYDEASILIPKYGPHFFHTDDKRVFDYLSRFTEWIPYEHRVLSNIKKKLVPVPVNITTVNRLFGLNIKNEEEMKGWLSNETEKINHPKNSEEAALRRVGKRLYDLLFKKYTKKQWDLWPHELEPEIMDRIPVRTNFDDRYFSDRFQAMPKKGYTALFENMLNHPNITVKLNIDYFKIRNILPKWDKLFFTGPIDRFFNYKYGKLQYRSLRFTHKSVNQEYYQSRAQINYPNKHRFTRITEPKHATRQITGNTTYIKEYPTWKGEPYYPVLSRENLTKYALYEKEANVLKNKQIYFVGRLANYRYYNMDKAFANALDVYEKSNTVY